MPKRAVFERSRRDLSSDASVGVSHRLSCGAIKPGKSVYGVCQDSDTYEYSARVSSPTQRVDVFSTTPLCFALEQMCYSTCSIF